MGPQASNAGVREPAFNAGQETTTLSEHQRITRRLRESEAQLHGMLSQSLVGVATIEDGMIESCNAKFGEVFGYSAEELKTIRCIDLTVEGEPDLVAGATPKRRGGEEEGVSYTSRGRCQDGTVIDIDVHATRVELDGRRLVISVVMDVTDYRHAQQEVKALHQRLHDQAVRDALTGLHNRRYVQESLEREFAKAREANDMVGVIIGDIDHFELVNSHYGHLAGDEVLRSFAAILKRRARSSDITCRYGGEEFLLVLPGTPEQIVEERAEQLRREIAASHVTYGEERIVVTASFGVAMFPAAGRSSGEVIEAAGAALHAAKAAGRNRVIVIR
jgi:diguanylate cyclase (GGDEF)-like protein/PAS domain S-box-containing protein